MSVRPTFAVFIATSLDGYIARPDGGIDWLEAVNAALPPGEDCGYGAFMADVDGIVMGRRTFEQVSGFNPWPFTVPVIALSSQPLTVPPNLSGQVTASAQAPATLAATLAAQGHRKVYVDGGETIRRFLAAGLIDTLTITIVPRLLGAGRPLFGDLEFGAVLHHLDTKTFPTGLTQVSYRLCWPDRAFPA